jgi:hypothetical protein
MEGVADMLLMMMMMIIVMMVEVLQIMAVGRDHVI